MGIQVKQSSPSLADSALRLPTDFPGLPEEVLNRFPSARAWEDEVDAFFQKFQSGVQDFAGAIQDTNELGGLLIADPQTGAIYIRPTRGTGQFADPITPFFVNQQGYFSLGSALTWNPQEQIFRIVGEIIATAGEIGGFQIGPDFIRDTADSFGLSSEMTGADDVRFWAGDTFANRGSAPFRVYESGAVIAIDGVIAGFTLSGTSFTVGSGSDFFQIEGTPPTITFGTNAVAPGILRIGIGGLGRTYGSTNEDFVLGDGSLQLYDDGVVEGLWMQGYASTITFGFSGDTNLYRNAANSLKTDDDLTVAGTLHTGTYVATPGAITGYLSIKDAGGTVRKIAVTT